MFYCVDSFRWNGEHVLQPEWVPLDKPSIVMIGQCLNFMHVAISHGWIGMLALFLCVKLSTPSSLLSYVLESEVFRCVWKLLLFYLYFVYLPKEKFPNEPVCFLFITLANWIFNSSYLYGIADESCLRKE